MRASFALLGIATTALASPGRGVAARGSLEAWNIRVEPAPGVALPDALAETLVDGVLLLPEALRRPPGGPLVLELRDTPSPFGMGEGSPQRPDWQGGRGRFVLYAYEEGSEPRAQFRLESLARHQRERLWRRRAIVHAILQRWNDQLRWSDRDEWKRISGWVRPGDRFLAFSERAANVYEWAYSRRRGMESAALDLMTFAEEALVPAEDAVPMDDRVRCQEFTKLRFLRDRFLSFGSLPEPLRGTASDCPAFLRWADLPHLSHIEVLWAAPSERRPQSLFGHLMLRPTYRNLPGDTRATDPVIEIAAIAGFDDHPAMFLVKGVTGGYLNAFDEITLGSVRAEQVDRDERDVRRFRLNLDEDERIRVMERLWEARRRGYYTYRFFSDNCASFTAFILGGAVAPERAVDVRDLVVPPSLVLDALSHGLGAGGRPLLERLPDALPSHRTVAANAEREQDRLIQALIAAAPHTADAWRAYIKGSRSPDPQRRRDAYAKLPALATLTLEPAPSPGLAQLVLDVVGTAVRMERYAAQVAEEAARALDVARVRLPPGTRLPSTAELVSERQRRYQRESGRDRLLETLSRHVQWANFFERLPRRGLTPEEASVTQHATRTRELFTVLTDIYAEMVERHAHLRSEEALRSTGGTELWPKTFSGYGHLSVGGATTHDGQGVRGQVLLRSAFLSERLGDRRANGLDPLAEVRLLESTMRWKWANGAPAFDGLELDVARVLRMPHEPALERRNVLDSFGYGVGLSYVRQGGAGRHGVLAHGDVAIPLIHTFEYAEHVIVLAGPALALNGPLLPSEALLGGRLELSGRLQLLEQVPSSARFEVSWLPIWRAVGGRQAWTHALRTALHVELAPSNTTRLQLELLVSSEWHWSDMVREHALEVAFVIGTP